MDHAEKRQQLIGGFPIPTSTIFLHRPDLLGFKKGCILALNPIRLLDLEGLVDVRGRGHPEYSG